ncbi:hypothetical protein CRI94_05400 [Longibacter salinarum]|uniref:Uncharacterized protein n=1 Tax=Longibacter salinarum TaxID=1850348 RepID=A0A2A8D0G6_9BACT|nr:hypothetical protein [Longibacter salinarum]PEN14462.1 hypothetical protein CRI94_05400 [Longibacter salinarum]
MPDPYEPLSGSRETSASRTVIIRDLIFFQIKLWLDGIKDIVLSPLSIIGAGIDILSGRSGQKSLFYKVMRLGERFDLWLNLYGPAREAATHPDGLLARRGVRSRDLIEQIDRASDTDRNALDEHTSSPPSRTT